jgi:hypothetical protein
MASTSHGRRLTREQAEALSTEDMQRMLEEYVSKGGQLLIEHPQEVLVDSNTAPGAELKVHPTLPACRV